MGRGIEHDDERAVIVAVLRGGIGLARDGLIAGGGHAVGMALHLQNDEWPLDFTDRRRKAPAGHGVLGLIAFHRTLGQAPVRRVVADHVAGSRRDDFGIGSFAAIICLGAYPFVVGES